jgi:hypothetical protein
MPKFSESEAKEMKEKMTSIKQEVSSDNTQPENQRPHQNSTIESVAQPSTITKYEKDSYILRTISPSSAEACSSFHGTAFLILTAPAGLLCTHLPLSDVI